MKKILVAALGLLCATTLVVNAKDKDAKSNLSDQQNALLQQMVEKYDIDKNKKLNKAETAKISKEDIEKLEKAGLLTPDTKKKTPKRKPAAPGAATTNAPAAPSHAPSHTPAPAAPAPAPAAAQ